MSKKDFVKDFLAFKSEIEADDLFDFSCVSVTTAATKKSPTKLKPKPQATLRPASATLTTANLKRLDSQTKQSVAVKV